MKRSHLCLILAILLLAALAAPAQAATRTERAELPQIIMKPILREGNLRRLYTEEGAFICPDGLYFGMPLEEAVDLLPLSETMRPGEEAFDERKRVEQPDGGFVTLNPYVYYDFEEIDDILELGVEFNADHELYACTLVRKPLMKLEDMSDSDRESIPLRLRKLVETFSEAADPLVVKGPEDMDSLDFAYFENGGQLKVYFVLGDTTCCQVSASVLMGHFTYNIILSRLSDMPAKVLETIEGLKAK